MRKQDRWPREAWVSVVAGLFWLWHAESFGLVGFLFSVIPGCLLLAAGVSTLLYPGDTRIPQFAAAGGLLGVPMAVPAMLVAGPATGLLLGALSAASFFTAGFTSVRQEPYTEDVPKPRASLRLAAEVATDDAILATLTVRAPILGTGQYDRLRHEIQEAREQFTARGWLSDPTGYHEEPPVLDQPLIRQRRSGRLAFEHLHFESGYEPHADEPGRARWLGYRATRTAHAWVLRHRDGPHPWLVCIHGYEMGSPWLDMAAFQAGRFHRRLGLNLVFPVLPLHGPRRIRRHSGDGFLAGDTLDTIHAEANTMWDIRRILSWIRAQGDSPIGVFGLSLGGYNTALLAALDAGLACAVAGIPATDFSRLTWRHGPTLQIRYAERQGMRQEYVREILRVVSPLAMPPLVAAQGRAIFAAVADRLVLPDQPRDLWCHWDRPRIVWYQGAHVTFRLHPEVDALVLQTLRDAGLSPVPA